MEKYCSKCFANLDKEPHQKWCPKKIDFDSLFPGLQKDIDDANKN
jgi:hypothetical protein